MKRRKLNPLSVLTSLKRRMEASRPLPLVFVPHDENAAFQALRTLLAQSKLLPSLDHNQNTARGERFVCINEDLLAQLYPGLSPFTHRLPSIDAFIYVYEGISDRDIVTKRDRGDLRPFLGEVGFRQLLRELERACKIHRFCIDNLRADRIVIEPITGKPTIEARKEAFGIPARGKEVFQQITLKISGEIEGTGADLPPVFSDARDFSHEMKMVLEPLARISKQVREEVAKVGGRCIPPHSLRERGRG